MLTIVEQIKLLPFFCYDVLYNIFRFIIIDFLIF